LIQGGFLSKEDRRRVKHCERSGADILGEREREVREFFDSQSESYPRFFSLQTHTGAACLFQHRLVRSAELLCGSHGTLLDCASGTGEITRAVIANSQFERAVINDFSPRMIERCREAFGEAMPAGSVTWTIHNVFDLGGIFRSGAFDVILCLGLIAHCGQFPRLMQEMSSLLKPGGTMLIQSSLLDHFSGRVVKYVAQSKLKRTNYVVESFYLKGILDEAKSAGFEVVTTDRFGLCLPFADRLLSPVNYWLERKFMATRPPSGGEALILLRKTA
jgi:ubiquinone/menaquinone biosynthesis C-methylase UbiE